MADDRPPTNPAGDYLLGQIVAELKMINRKVDMIDTKLDNHNARMDKIEREVESLAQWRNEHMKWHEEDERNFKVSKETFWGLVAAIIASGLIFKALTLFKGG